MGRLELAALGLFVPALRETVEMLYGFEAPFVAAHGKFAAVFGDVATPLERALANTVDWARRRG